MSDLRSRLRRAAGTAVLAVLGLLAACLVAEVVLRVMDVEGLSLNVTHPVLGQTYRPSHDTVRHDPESGRRVRVTTNSLGFRDRERRTEPSGTRRVLVLGDSFVAGLAVDFERTFPQVAEQRLTEATGTPWEVLNFGVAGYGTAQELLAYREYGRAFDPEVVVLAFFSGNDVSDNSSELSTNPRVYYRLSPEGRLELEPPARARRWASEMLNRHSRFYVWQKTWMNRLEHLVKKKAVVNPVHRVFAATYNERLERAWRITLALVATLQEEVERDGGRPLALYIPYSDEVNPDWWRKTLAESPPLQGGQWDLAKPERIFREHCQKRGLELLTPRQVFLDEAAAGRRFYFQHGHLNEDGHRRLGELLAQKVLERQDSPPRSSRGAQPYHPLT